MNGAIGAGAGLAGSYGPSPQSPLTKTLTLGGTHDYASDINNDPAYKQLKDLLSAQGISDAAHLRGAIQQALIQFGAVPNLPGDVLSNSGLDTGLTSQLADNNPFSTLKRLAQDYQDRGDAAKNQLAARGILNSGETGYQLGRLGQNQAQSQYDVTNSLLGSLGSLNDAYAQGQQAHAQQLAQGAFVAEQNQANSGGAPPQQVTATYNPQTGTWVDPTGNHYDQNGNPISLPSQAPPEAPQAPPAPNPVAQAAIAPAQAVGQAASPGGGLVAAALLKSALGAGQQASNAPRLD